MSFTISVVEGATRDLRNFRASDRSAIMEQIKTMLSMHPLLESQSRIKLLRQPAPAQYRLRIGDYRVFYDVEEKSVTILAVLHKQDTGLYLRSAINDKG